MLRVSYPLFFFCRPVRLQADTTVYNANTDMIASETGASPSATFGDGNVWQIGWADPLTFPAAAVVGSAATSHLSGWGRADSNDASYVVVNSLGATNTAASSWSPLAKDEMVFHPGNPEIESDSYTLLNWTAPRAGKINVTTSFENVYASRLPR